MNNEKILTIAVPTYNIENYIEKCLGSIINTDLLPLIEVIVVNDGSTDNSSNIAKKYSKLYPNTYYVIDKENGGHGSAINTALKHANGKYFMVVDGDDWIDNKALLNVLSIAKDNEDLDAIFFSEIVEVKSNNTRKIRDFNKIFNEGYINLNESKANLDNLIGLANFMIKVDNLRNINLQLTEKAYYVDIEYVLFSLATIKKAMYINEYVYHYLVGRLNQSTNIKTALQHINDRRLVINKVLDYFSKLDFSNISKFATDTYYIRMASVINDYYDIQKI